MMVFLIDLYSFSSYGDDGSVWFSSELKALQAHCGHFEAFPPGKDLDITMMDNDMFVIASYCPNVTVFFE